LNEDHIITFGLLQEEYIIELQVLQEKETHKVFWGRTLKLEW